MTPAIPRPMSVRIFGDRVDFTYLKELLGTTDGNLGAHLAKLEEAGYILLEKAFVARKPRTFVLPTDKGRSAFQDHVKALHALLEAPAPPKEPGQ